MRRPSVKGGRRRSLAVPAQLRRRASKLCRRRRLRSLATQIRQARTRCLMIDAGGGARTLVEVRGRRRAREGVRTPVEVRGGRPPLEVWTLGKECGRRRARAPWPLAAGGSTDADAPGPREGGEQARGTSRSETLAPSAGGSKILAAMEMGRAGAGRGRRRQDMSGRRRQRGAGEKVGSLTASEEEESALQVFTRAPLYLYSG